MRQRVSNHGVLLSGPDTPQSQLQLIVETAPGTLSSNPHTLQRLYHKFKFGINGRKPADQFTTVEKNANKHIKHKYWRRDVLCQTIARLFQGGRIVQVAIHQIQNAYGEKLVSLSLLMHCFLTRADTQEGSTQVYVSSMCLMSMKFIFICLLIYFFLLGVLLFTRSIPSRIS